MGFALWIEQDTLWAAGTHEYRPMGAAVVAAGSAFTTRDFSRYLKPPPRHDPRFAGLFASLGELNHFLARRRRRHSTSKTFFVDYKPRKNRVVLEF
ncbi:MAG: hypothetical protein HY821_01415 [Acidobacteria bacterium]|nr:hypothetical protein [Acidobacteriota bacterium]